MNLSIWIRTSKSGTVLLRLFGSLVVGRGVERLRDALDVLVGKHEQILIDMTYVNRLDAGGVGCLVRAYAEGCAKGTRVSLLKLPPRIREVLVIVKLITVFGIGDHAEAA